MRGNSFVGIAALLFALANPIGVIPIFLGFTQRLKNVDPQRIIVLASITVARSWSRRPYGAAKYRLSSMLVRMTFVLPEAC